MRWVKLVDPTESFELMEHVELVMAVKRISCNWLDQINQIDKATSLISLDSINQPDEASEINQVHQMNQVYWLSEIDDIDWLNLDGLSTWKTSPNWLSLLNEYERVKPIELFDLTKFSTSVKHVGVMKWIERAKWMKLNMGIQWIQCVLAGIMALYWLRQLNYFNEFTYLRWLRWIHQIK